MQKEAPCLPTPGRGPFKSGEQSAAVARQRPGGCPATSTNAATPVTRRAGDRGCPATGRLFVPGRWRDQHGPSLPSPPPPGRQTRRGTGGCGEGRGGDSCGSPNCRFPRLRPPTPSLGLSGSCGVTVSDVTHPQKNTTPQNRSKHSGLVFFWGAQIWGPSAWKQVAHTHTYMHACIDIHAGGISAQRPLCPAPLPCTPAPLLACVLSSLPSTLLGSPAVSLARLSVHPLCRLCAGSCQQRGGSRDYLRHSPRPPQTPRPGASCDGQEQNL